MKMYRKEDEVNLKLKDTSYQKSSIKKTYLLLQTLPSITPVLNDDEDASRTRTLPILSSSSPRKTTPPKIHHTAVKIPKMTEVFMWIQGGQN